MMHPGHMAPPERDRPGLKDYYRVMERGVDALNATVHSETNVWGKQMSSMEYIFYFQHFVQRDYPGTVAQNCFCGLRRFFFFF